MKKFITIAVSLILCFSTTISAFAAIPEGWREISDEELGLPTEEEARRITETERNKERAISDDMYAALFAANEKDVDTITDITTAGNHLNNMNYNVEKYINDSYRKIDRLYFCTDILVFAGHGLYDKVKITPKESLRTNENCTGVYMGDKNITYQVNYLIGLGRRNMSDCRFAMFAACQTANPNYVTNIAKSTVYDYGAESSIGWRVDVSSEGLHEWEKEFFKQIENGETLYTAKKNADAVLKGSDVGTKYPDIFLSTIYGNSNILLSKNRSKSNNNTNLVNFVTIDEPLNINCKNDDIDELTQYLEENLDEFDSNLFNVESITNTVDGKNYYEIIYSMKINNFETPYNVIVFVEDDNIEYIASFNKSDCDNLASMPSVIGESDFTDSIKIAKEKALKYVPNDATVDNQETRLILDCNLSPLVIVKTVCVDDSGCNFVLDYEYDLNY